MRTKEDNQVLYIKGDNNTDLSYNNFVLQTVQIIYFLYFMVASVSEMCGMLEQLNGVTEFKTRMQLVGIYEPYT